MKISKQAHISPVLTTHAEAIKQNTKVFLDSVNKNTQVMAVVKADGYGHGYSWVAEASLAAGATWLGVTSISEAAILRESGLHHHPILSWLNATDIDASELIELDTDIAIAGPEQLKSLLSSIQKIKLPGSGKGLRVHLQFDMGMAREGCAEELWDELITKSADAEKQGLIRVIGLMSHLRNSGEKDLSDNALAVSKMNQVQEKAKISGLTPQLTHLAATGATLTDPSTHFDLVRIGAGLVGIDPSETRALYGASTLTAPVIQHRRIRRGETVGYSRTWTAPKDTNLALIPVGYADAILRNIPENAGVQIAGRRCNIVGRVSMDQIVVDTGDHEVALGEIAIIWGPGESGEPTIHDWAEWEQTIEHEIVTTIGPRVIRELA